MNTNIEDDMNRKERPKLEHGMMGRLSIYGDGMNFDIPSNQGTKEHVIAMHGNDSWQIVYYIFYILKR
jgi:hypothetical protein